MSLATAGERSAEDVDQDAELVLEYAWVHLAHGCSPDDELALSTLVRFADHDPVVLERASLLALDLASVSRTFVFVSELLRVACRRAAAGSR